MSRNPFISLVIPCKNGASTIAACLEAVCASRYDNYEIIVVDDNSSDESVEIIGKYDLKLIRLNSDSGASKARNAGAAEAGGEALFFIDADCVMPPDTLHRVAEAFNANPAAITGGTYTPLPHDKGSFFSTFQSIYIHHSETHNPEPDYIATHAMIISRELFLQSGGFKEEFMPILEDVEFSHRLREAGSRLIMRPDIMVSHIFNFDLRRSIKNAYRKSFFWVRYSAGKGDLMSDSGTASLGLKVMAACTLLSALLFLIGLVTRNWVILLFPPAPLIAGIVLNTRLFEAFFRHGGIGFGLMAVPYYAFIYPLVAVAGGVAGLMKK